jgi:hypothetical protein
MSPIYIRSDDTALVFDFGLVTRNEPVSLWRAQMSKLVHNEKVKLTATLLNNLAVAALTTGWLVPLINFVRMDSPEKKDVITFSIISLCLGVGFFWVLSIRALHVLNGLIE